MIHDWPSDMSLGSGSLFGANGFGMSAGFGLGEFGTRLCMNIYYASDFTCTYLTPAQTQDATLATKIAYVRAQWDPTAKQVTWEAWDMYGFRFYNEVRTYGSAATTSGSSGLQFGDIGGETNGLGRAIGFFRLYNTLVAANSRVPVTADASAAIVNLKFDGNLNDSSGHGYNGTIPTGSISYVTTPGQIVQSVVTTPGAPYWATTITQRAGFPVVLDGSASYSQADASATVTCAWQVLQPAPSMPTFSSRTSCGPITLTGMVFGDYPIQLTVTDSAGTKNVGVTHIGAVAMDANGIVINGNPDVDVLFGPMIAWGRNPWGFADERQMRSTVLRNAYYTDPAQGHLGNPTWATPGQGTISYTMGGKGVHPISPGGTTLASAITTATQLSITVTDATQLDLTAFPTRIKIENEEIRVCSASGNVLTVCYDGRGYASPQGTLLAASSHANGVGVGQYKITGTGTLFASDPNSPICPAGTPSAPGAILTSAGTVAVTAGSATLVGTGTGWVVGPNINTGTPGYVFAGQPIRVLGTHSGTPFVFLAQVAGIADSTHLTLNRSFPADADTASGLTYQILFMGQENQLERYIVLHYTRPSDGSDSNFATPVGGCESETALYISYVNRDFSGLGLNGTLQSGKKYSYITASDAASYLNSGSTGGINFYGPGIADRSLYYRSGIKLAETTANMVDDNWIKSPSVAGHDVGGIDLFLGAGVIGAVANAVLNPGRVNWSDIRGFANYAKDNFTLWNGIGYCNGTRETGYNSAWLSLAAIYDPDVTPATGKRALYNAAITSQMIPNETACKGTDASGVHPERINSWATSSGYVRDNDTPVTLTNGSTAGTFLGTAKNLCRNEAAGSGTATNGSTALTGTGFAASSRGVGNGEIVIVGTKSGGVFQQYLGYTYNSSTSMTLSAAWQGDTGTVTYTEIYGGSIDGTPNDFYYGLVFSNGVSTDPQLYQSYACTYNSGAGTFTLNRPWTGTTGTKYASIYNLSGTGQQPFMMGIRSNAWRFGSHLADYTTDTQIATNAAALNTLRAQGSQWVKDYGYDAPGHHLYYGRVFGHCEPDALATANCAGDPSLNAEAQSTIVALYQLNPSSANLAYGDQFYAANWGNAAYTAGGYATDAGYNSYFTQDAYLAGGKWPGFYFGMGATHQWPAVRLGGVAAAIPRSVKVGFNLASVSGATTVKVLVTAPSGAQTTTTCTTSPCTVAADARQGAHVLTIQYWNAAPKLLAQSSQAIPASVQ
jgi:hypothetical protein